MRPVETKAVGDRAVRFRVPDGVPRAALLAWLRDRPGVSDASLAAEHALVVLEGSPVPIEIPDLAASAASVPVEHVIRVAYDGEDLDEVAALASLSRDEVVARHVASALTVAFVGFCPGFAYLVGLDPALAAIPRRAAPRPRVPENAVAIAGGYGGVYPAAMPGGWRLIGRAVDARLIEGEHPRLRVGDRVRFAAQQ